MKNTFLLIMVLELSSICFAQSPTTPIIYQDCSKNGIVVVDHESVDLGLSVKWAKCNIGASQPEEYGSRFAWGEVAPKSSYSWLNYKHCNGSQNTLTKYCNDSQYGIVDNKAILEAEDDAAYVNWGGNWRMPTKGEFGELLFNNNLNHERIYINKKEIFKISNKETGNYILLPVESGYCYFWTSTAWFYYGWSYYFYYSSYVGGIGTGDERYLGKYVRAVCNK